MRYVQQVTVLNEMNTDAKSDFIKHRQCCESVTDTARVALTVTVRVTVRFTVRVTVTVTVRFTVRATVTVRVTVFIIMCDISH